MRRLILSDIHANWEALQAVLAHANEAYDELVCCGDLVGYGASPGDVLDWVKESVRVVVRGNHDKACCGLEDLDWFNDVAKAAALWTAEEIGEDGRAYLQDLPRGPLVTDGFTLAHGSPVDEDAYLVNDIDVAGLDQHIFTPMAFFGHTHLQGGWMWGYGGHQKVLPPTFLENRTTIEIRPDRLYLLNPGSVGQPRDNDPRAAYLIWDTEARTVTFHRTNYDIAGAQRRIRAAGLPDLLASRLAAGR